MNTNPEGEPARLQAGDAFSAHVLRVAAEARPADVFRERQSRCTQYFAIFDGDCFTGLVSSQNAFLSSPWRIFADLLPRQLLPPVPPETPVADLVRAMERFDTDALPVVDSSGSFLGIVTKESVFHVLHDHQQRLNAVIAEHEQMTQSSAWLVNEELVQFRNAVEQSADIVFITDRDGVIEYLNPAFETITGYSKEEALGKTSRILKSGLMEPEHNQRMWAAIRSGEVFCAQIIDRKKSGELFYFDQTITPVKDDHGNITHFVSTGKDVTERKQAEQEANLLLMLIKAIAKADSFDSALTLALGIVCESTGWDFGEVWIPSRDDTRLELGAPYYCRVRDAESFRSVSEGFEFAPGIGLPGRVWVSKNPAWIPDVTLDADFPRDTLAKEVGIKAAMGIPILADNSVVAVMDFLVREARQEDARMIALVSAVAAELGVVLQRKRAGDAIRRRRNELEALAKVSAALRQAQTRAAMLPLLVEAAMEVLQADAGALLLLEDKTLVLAVARGPGAAFFEQHVPQGDEPLWEVVRSGQPLFIPDMTEQSEFTRRGIRHALVSGMKACACIPLKVSENTTGVLHLAYQSPRTATEDDIRVLTSIGEMGGSALHRARLREQVAQDVINLSQAYESTLEGWARALDLRDRETEGHTRRVTEMTMRMARAMGVSEAELVHIHRGAVLHDIGKMGVPDSILLKPGPLTDDEWKVMRQHVQFALDMLAPIAYLRPALDIPGCHHEKWDGAGYPRGLKGEQIPLAARLFAVVDVWDALRSDRPYREAWPEAKVLEHIRSLAGTHFDPKAVDLFLRVVSEKTEEHQGAS